MPLIGVSGSMSNPSILRVDARNKIIFDEITDYDRAVIRALYSEAIVPGMNRRETLYRLRGGWRQRNTILCDGSV